MALTLHRRRSARGRFARIAVVLASTVAAGCAGAPEDGVIDGPAVSIAVAPLDLPSVGDADWGLRVLNDSGDVVWERPSLLASSYGNGQSLAYVGPCDADPDEQPNRVELTLNGLYATGGALMDPGSYENPTVPTALVQAVVCEENEDAAVTFDVTLLRNASQGFFDVAVSFSDLFCSAKFDCSRDAAGNEPLNLVHDPDTGARLPSAVLALACTGGVDADTHLYLDDITITCDTPATFTLDPSAGPGNVFTGSAGANPAPAGAPFSQAQIFRGQEQLTNGSGGDYAKFYWNVALGLDLDGFSETCTLSTTATAASGAFTDFAPATSTTYPVIEYTIDPFITAGALACAQNPVNGDGSDVATSYLSGEPPHNFNHLLTDDGSGGLTVGTYSPAPTIVTPTDVISARAGTVCTTQSGGAWCWGSNNWYNTGATPNSSRVTPYNQTMPGTVTTAEAGVHGSCAVSDGTVYCWGSAGESPFTFGSAAVNTGITNAVDVGSGDIAYCALLANGDVDCAGQNTKYVVTGGESLTNVDQLDLNDHHGCARIGGEMWCFGRNNTGQSGASGCGGGDDCLTTPRRIGTFDDAVDFAVGHASVCALLSDGTVWCWGRNDFGQLGRGSTSGTAPTPAEATALPADVVALDIGYSHLCVVTSLGAVYCLGENLHGKIGNGLTSGNQLTAYEVALPDQATEVALTSYNSCAVLVTGEIYCWGRNSAGECATGDTASPVLTPSMVSGLP